MRMVCIRVHVYKWTLALHRECVELQVESLVLSWYSCSISKAGLFCPYKGMLYRHCLCLSVYQICFKPAIFNDKCWTFKSKSETAVQHNQVDLAQNHWNVTCMKVTAVYDVIQLREEVMHDAVFWSPHYVRYALSRATFWSLLHLVQWTMHASASSFKKGILTHAVKRSCRISPAQNVCIFLEKENLGRVQPSTHWHKNANGKFSLLEFFVVGQFSLTQTTFYTLQTVTRTSFKSKL